jgi:hypothetical protein
VLASDGDDEEEDEEEADAARVDWRQHGAPPSSPGANQANKQTTGRVFRFTPRVKPEEARSSRSKRKKTKG